MSGGGRRRAVRRCGPGVVTLICTLAAIVLFVGTLMAYGRRQVLDTGAFTKRAVDVLHEEPVRRMVAETLTRHAIEAGSPDLVAVRPLLEGTVSRLLGSGELDGILSRATAEAHRSLFSSRGSPVVLSLADALVVAQGVVAAVRPGTRLPNATTAGQVTVAERDDTKALRVAKKVRWLGFVLPIMAIALLWAAVLLARERRRAVAAAGLAITSAGLLVVLAVAIVRTVVVGQFDGDAADVARASWKGIVGGLANWGLVLIGAGALIAAGAASILPAGDVAGRLARLKRLALATPAGTRGTFVRIFRACAAIGVGILAVTDPQTTLRLVFLAAGAIAIMWGLTELLGLSRRADGTAPDEMTAVRRRAGRAAARLTAGVGAAAVVGLGAVALATGGGGSAPPPVPLPCNGHPELCDRRLDEVSLVATHNSMSVARNPGWFNAHHYNPIVDQLDGGVRGLLIDTWLGQQTVRDGFGGTRRVQTDLSDTSREALVEEIGPEAVAAAERLSGRILYGQAVPKPTLYMCHGLCEVGATDAVAEFTRIRRWLDDHPDQVIVIVIQDQSTIARDVAAIEAAGLDDRAWPTRLTAADELPTLREMIDTGKTAVIMHESSGQDGPAWYQSAYAITQETPYLFRDVAAISSRRSCVPNRGPADARLFLLNHWLDLQPVRASQAEEVNRRSVLLERARLCRSVRNRVPNLVAVNFAEIGDTAAVVDELNGVRTPGG